MTRGSKARLSGAEVAPCFLPVQPDAVTSVTGGSLAKAAPGDQVPLRSNRNKNTSDEKGSPSSPVTKQASLEGAPRGVGSLQRVQLPA